MAVVNGVKVKLLKPMAIGEKQCPAGCEVVVGADRAERWIGQRLAVDPSGKIESPPDEKAKSKRGKPHEADDE